MSDISRESSGSEDEIFEGSDSDAFLEVEIDGEDDLEDIPAEILPYMFEPRQRILEGRPEDQPRKEIPSEQELEDQWCLCGHCQPQNKKRENICCNSIPNVMEKLSERADKPLACITDHPGFIAVCTNVWALETAWYYYKQQYEDAYEGPRHKKFRHVAYRQFVQWIWHYLGRHVRVVLPSCAVSCIRAHFPPPGDEEDFVFEGFKLPDI